MWGGGGGGGMSLFTACLLSWVKSSHQSRCHVSPTQDWINSMHSHIEDKHNRMLERTEPERRKAW